MQIKNKYINRFLQSRIVRNTSVLLSGNMLAQIITLAAYPIISRIYSPDEMGTLNLFVSIFAILFEVVFNAALLANSPVYAVFNPKNVEGMLFSPFCYSANFDSQKQICPVKNL